MRYRKMLNDGWDDLEREQAVSRAERLEQKVRNLTTELDIWQESRAMLVARLNNMYDQGDKWLTVISVHALMNDCDMLASRSKT